ncbi:MAG: hypothetical protein K6G22_00210 [Lachnospiraceae bacterium]|nr:hypothetical protein [Lachnospiraceae bacterium]
MYHYNGDLDLGYHYDPVTKLFYLIDENGEIQGFDGMDADTFMALFFSEDELDYYAALIEYVISMGGEDADELLDVLMDELAKDPELEEWLYKAAEGDYDTDDNSSENTPGQNDIYYDDTGSSGSSGDDNDDDYDNYDDYDWDDYDDVD